MKRLLIFILLLPSWPARADDPCFPRADLLRALDDRFHQASVASGAARGGTVEIFTTADGSAWTLIITLDDGSACILGAGTDWQAAKPGPIDPNAGEPL